MKTILLTLASGLLLASQSPAEVSAPSIAQVVFGNAKEDDPVYLRFREALRPWFFHGYLVLLVPLMDDAEKSDFRDVYHMFPLAVTLIMVSGAGDLETARYIAEFPLLLYEHRAEHPELLDAGGDFRGFPEVYHDRSGNVALLGDIVNDPNLVFRGTGPTAWLGVGLLNYLQALMDKPEPTVDDLQQQERLFALCEAIATWLVELQVKDPERTWLDGGVIGAVDDKTGEVRLGPYTEGNAAVFGYLHKLIYLESRRGVSSPKTAQWAEAADRLGKWFQWVIEQDQDLVRVYVGRTREGKPVEGVPGQIAEAVDTYAFLVLAGVVDAPLAQRFVDRVLESGAVKQVVDATGRHLTGLAFGPQGDTPYWGPHGQVALAARFSRHPQAEELFREMQAGLDKGGLPVFVRLSGLADNDKVRDWTGKPGDAAWVGDLSPAIEPTVWYLMANHTPENFNPFGPITWEPPIVGEPIPTIVEEDVAATPQIFALEPNYPNPFNSDTVIRFVLPQREEVELSVFDLAGQKVASLVQEAREAGRYEVRWDGRDSRERQLASGVYLCRLQAGKQVETRKLLLLR